MVWLEMLYNVEPRAPSFLYKMLVIKIHDGSCPSSHTLLSTASFQMKFHNNISLKNFVVDIELIQLWNHE